MSSNTDSKVGKFTMSVQPSGERGPKPQDRIEAIAAWLLKQWQKTKEASRGNK